MKKNQILMGLAGGVVFAVAWILLSGFQEVIKPLIGGLIFFVCWVIATFLNRKK